MCYLYWNYSGFEFCGPLTREAHDARYAPGRYARILAYVSEHPGATMNEVCYATDSTRPRFMVCVRYGMQTGTVRRERTSPRKAWKYYAR